MTNREAIKVLRRALKPRTNEEMAAINRANEASIRDWWLAEHPGRTRAEYRRLLSDPGGEVWQWRRAKGRAINQAERTERLRSAKRFMPADGISRCRVVPTGISALP